MNDDIMDDFDENSFNLSQEVLSHKQAADVNLAMCMALESIERNAVNSSPERIAAMANFSLNTAMEAIGGDSLSKYQTLTLEELGHEKKRFWARFKHHLASYYKQVVDHYQTFWTFTEFQTKRLKKIKSQLQSIRGNSKVEIRTPLSKYMKYGDNRTIETSKEYVEKFIEMKKVMVNTCVAASDLNDNSKFNIGAYLVDKVTWNGDEFVMDHFRTLNEIIRNVISSEGMKKVRNTELYEVYATENLLGMSQVICKAPLKNLVKYNDYDTAIDLVGQMYMFVDRIQKFSTETLNSNSDFIEFDHKQIDTLIKACEDLIDEATRLLRFANKYNAFIDDIMVKLLSLVSYGITPAVVSTLYKDTRVEPGDVDILPSIRIITRYMSMCYDCTSSSYNFSMGNIKKALSIAESFVKRAS